MKITGSIIQAYIICPRQAWLMSRQISGDQYNEFLSIGRLIDEESYSRDKKEVVVGSNKIDFIRTSKDELLIVETKKSSKMQKASEAQLLYYLYSLRHKYKNVKGELRVPKEKMIIPVELDDANTVFVEKIIKELKELFKREIPPENIRIGACKKCSYLEFCWS